MEELSVNPRVAPPRPPPSWCRDFIGIPFRERGRGRDGVDCWGLVRLVFEARWRIILPDWSDSYVDTRDRAAIPSVVLAERAAWRRVPEEEARAGDVAVLRLAGVPMHVGVVAAWPWMLHVERGLDAACERLDGLAWRSRLEGLWRHPDMVE